MNLFIEKYYPLIVSCFITLSAVFFISESRLVKLLDVTIDKSFTFSGILMGFLLTILTIIGSIETKKMRLVKQSGNYQRMQKYLHRALYANLFLLVISFFISVFDLQNAQVLTRELSALLLFVAVYTIALSVRFSILIIQLLED